MIGVLAFSIERGEALEKENIGDISELQIGNIKFQIVSHFKETGSYTIQSTLAKLMEKERENRTAKLDSS